VAGPGGGFFPPPPRRLNKALNYLRHFIAMRFLVAMAFALLILNFVDEHYNDGIYTRAVESMVLEIRHSIGV